MTTEHGTGYKARLLDAPAYHLRVSTTESGREALRMLDDAISSRVLTPHEHVTVTRAQEDIAAAIGLLIRAQETMQELMPKEAER